jgi:hypothetical protein
LFDNNFGNNYLLDVAAAEGTDGVGLRTLRVTEFVEAV